MQRVAELAKFHQIQLCGAKIAGLQEIFISGPSVPLSLVWGEPDPCGPASQASCGAFDSFICRPPEEEVACWRPLHSKLGMVTWQSCFMKMSCALIFPFCPRTTNPTARWRAALGH
jgi:hypothetical protein